jgi:hypothetical protein
MTICLSRNYRSVIECEAKQSRVIDSVDCRLSLDGFLDCFGDLRLAIDDTIAEVDVDGGEPGTRFNPP